MANSIKARVKLSQIAPATVAVTPKAAKAVKATKAPKAKAQTTGTLEGVEIKPYAKRWMKGEAAGVLGAELGISSNAMHGAICKAMGFEGEARRQEYHAK